MDVDVLWAKAFSYQKREAIIIDYFLKFNTEADAIAAAEAAGKLGRRNPDNSWSWDMHYVLPNITAWRISQDNADGTHNYLAGWFCTVSTANPNAQLSNDPNLAIELDRDGPPYVRKNKTGIPANDLAFQPVFLGSHYPIGGLG